MGCAVFRASLFSSSAAATFRFAEEEEKVVVVVVVVPHSCGDTFFHGVAGRRAIGWRAAGRSGCAFLSCSSTPLRFERHPDAASCRARDAMSVRENGMLFPHRTAPHRTVP